MQDKYRLLLIEDDPDVIEITILRLEHAGYEVISATNGNEGLLKASSEIPDLILLDLKIPGINGIEVCKRLKDDDKLNNIPVIILTANDNTSIKQLYRDIKADDYLSKPYEPHILISKIQTLLSK